jgi:hypothetical protein
MVVAVVFVALIIIVLMFVFRRHNYQSLTMATASLQPSGAVFKNLWYNKSQYKFPNKKLETVIPRKNISEEKAIEMCKSGGRGYCERVQTDGNNYKFINWPPIAPCPTPSCKCPITEPCNCPKANCQSGLPTACTVDSNTGLPFWTTRYRGGEKKSLKYIPIHKARELNYLVPKELILYNNGILPYSLITGYTLYPYNPYTGKRLIDEDTDSFVAIDELGLAKFSSDTRFPWYVKVGMIDMVAPNCPVGANWGLPAVASLGGMPISLLDLNIEYSPIKSDDLSSAPNYSVPIYTLKTDFDKSKVQRWIENIDNLPKNPNTGLPLYPYNPYTGMPIIDPKTGNPVEIFRDTGLAMFKQFIDDEVISVPTVPITNLAPTTPPTTPFTFPTNVFTKPTITTKPLGTAPTTPPTIPQNTFRPQ